MTKYAVKSPKGREFMYSKKNVIELGDRTKKVLDYAIDRLNALTVGDLACKDNEVWRICDDDYMCQHYAVWKAIIGKRGFRLERMGWN